jgi:hypothetical protein
MMDAGRELDALIAEKVMGYDDILMPDCYGRPPDMVHVEHYRHEIPHYSTQIADAWLVVEKLSFEFYMERRPQEDYWVLFTDAEDEWHVGEADTAPLAICLAALKAVE